MRYNKESYVKNFKNKNYNSIVVYVPQGIREELQEYANLNEISLGCLIRKAIREYTQIDTRMPTEK